MRALAVLALGVVLVGLEFRTDALDLLLDPLGWLLVAAGAWRLAPRAASLLAVVAAPLSLSTTYLSFRTVLVTAGGRNPVVVCPQDFFCYEQLRYDELSGLRASAVLGMAVAGAAALTLVIRSLRTEVGDVTKQRPLRRQLRALEWAVPIVWFLPLALRSAQAVITGDGYDPVWDESSEQLVFARVAVVAWLAVMLLVFSDRYPRAERRSAKA